MKFNWLKIKAQAWSLGWLLAVAFLAFLPILAEAANSPQHTGASQMSDREPSFFTFSRRQAKKIRPLWSDPKFIRDSANQSILYSGAPTGFERANSSEVVEWLKADQSVETTDLRIRYQQLERYNDSRRAFGQNSFGDQNQTNERKRNLGRDALVAVRNARTDAERRRFIETPLGAGFKELLDDPSEALNLNETQRKTVVTVAAIAAISVGQPVVLQVNRNVRVFARTEVHNQAFDFRMASPAIESHLAFNATAPIGVANPNNERYQVSVGRPLPIWSLRSDLQYGGSSALVAATLSKRISRNLIATLKSERDSGMSNLPRFRAPEESVTVDYQFHF